MPKPSRGRTVLFQRNGELAEFAALLCELATSFEELTSRFPEAADLEGARLVIVSGKRLVESGSPNIRNWPRTIAVIDDSSKTLVHHLRRIGVAMVIRRPIHPRALRLLMLHEIYCGPERRSRKRTLIGHPIRVTLGLFRPLAMLLELSLTGARIELANAPKVGRKFGILLGKDLTNGKPMKVPAQVMRSIGSSTKNNREVFEVGVAILNASRHVGSIKPILERFALGPASWKSKQPSAALEVPVVADPKAGMTIDKRKNELPPPRTMPRPAPITAVNAKITLPVAEALPVQTTRRTPLAVEAPAIENPAVIDEASTATPERRGAERIPYDRRVVALGEEAARVLVGRDLSCGGMRIAASPAISVGDLLKVALHSGTPTEPLIVLARVMRDDGNDGLVLTFDELSRSQRGQLEKIVASGLPVHASADDFDVEDGEDENEFLLDETIVVAEMLETLHPETESEIAAHLDSVFDASEQA